MAESVAPPVPGDLGLSDAIDRLFTALPYSDAQKAKGETDKFWWEPSCKWYDGIVGLDASASEQALAEYRTKWAIEHGAWVLVAATDPEPVVQVPARILAVIAEAEARRQVRMPRLEFSPAAGKPTYVGLRTAVWANPADWSQVRATASQGTEAANVWADPVAMTFGGLPAGSETGDCADGGTAYTPGGAEPACYIKFARSSGQAPGRTWTVTVTVTWEVGADVPLGGVPEIQTQATAGFQVQEIQAVGSRLHAQGV
jgi:hypothetical protein